MPKPSLTRALRLIATNFPEMGITQTFGALVDAMLEAKGGRPRSAARRLKLLKKVDLLLCGLPDKVI